jgi:hypothetical protein
MLARVQKFMKLINKILNGSALISCIKIAGPFPDILRIFSVTFEILFPKLDIVFADFPFILFVNKHSELHLSKLNLVPSSHSYVPRTSLSPHILLHIPL